MISEVLGDAGNNGTVFDTGGELIGIGELVKVTRLVISPQAQIIRDLRKRVSSQTITIRKSSFGMSH